MLTLDRPRDSDTHTAADFAELLCLIQPDRMLSQADLADHIRDAGAGGDVDELIGEPKREQSCRDEEQLDDTFAHLVWRTGAFGDGYPFSIVSGDNVLRERRSNYRTLKRDMYSFWFAPISRSCPTLNVCL